MMRKIIVFFISMIHFQSIGISIPFGISRRVYEAEVTALSKAGC